MQFLNHCKKCEQKRNSETNHEYVVAACGIRMKSWLKQLKNLNSTLASYLSNFAQMFNAKV